MKEESLLQKRTFTDANSEFEKPEELPVHFGRKGSAARHQKLRQQKEEVKDTAQKRKLETNLEDKYGKGLKLLQKLGGFEVGQGAGKRNQGITAPVEAVINKDKACLGTGKFDEKAKEEKVLQDK